MNFSALKIWIQLIGGATILTLVGCGRFVTECGGLPLNTARLAQIRNSSSNSGSKAQLITPNPIDATGDISLNSFASFSGSIFDSVFLPNMTAAQRLENDFLKVRIATISDSPDILATPNSNGEYAFDVSDVHYGETMAYHSLTAIQNYVEALGFSTIKSRPLYVMVKSEGSTNNPADVNAFYDHNYFDPSLPRELKIFGDTAYAPREDRDIYWHEFGHYFFESLSSERGVDFAGDSGAVFTEGGAIHECMADYGAESLSGRGYLGRWVARNFADYPAGSPLRSAEDKNDDFDNFSRVSQFDPSGINLDRYRIGEWCTRVLWDIRKQIVKENPIEGQYYADRMIFAAASLLKRDTSVTELKTALLQADEALNCGIHSRSVANAFSSRGFPTEVPSLSSPLVIRAAIVWLKNDQGQTTNEFSFNFTLSNPNAQNARNVRVILESLDGRVTPIIYQQAYGDLGSGKTVTVGENGPIPLSYSVQGSVAANGNYRGSRFILRIKTENGPDTVVQGAL
jgi:hypothetical protein